MSDTEKRQVRREVEQLTSAIQEIATRMSAEFVVDEKKTQIYSAASEQRSASSRNDR